MAKCSVAWANVLFLTNFLITDLFPAAGLDSRSSLHLESPPSRIALEPSSSGLQRKSSLFTKPTGTFCSDLPMC